MPTFTHQPCAVLPKFKGKLGTPKLSFFPAELWEDEHGGKPGMWRIASGDKYVTRDGEDISFFTLEGITSLVMDHLADGLAAPVELPGIRPDVTPKTPVRYWPHGQTQPLETYTKTAPFTDRMGEFRVWIYYKDNPVLLTDLELREDHRRTGGEG